MCRTKTMRRTKTTRGSERCARGARFSSPLTNVASNRQEDRGWRAPDEGGTRMQSKAIRQEDRSWRAPDEGCNRMQSKAIRQEDRGWRAPDEGGTRMQSKAIRQEDRGWRAPAQGDQSDALSRTQLHPDALSHTQTRSDALRCTQTHSDALTSSMRLSIHSDGSGNQTHSKCSPPQCD